MRTALRPAVTALWMTALVAAAANLVVLLGALAAAGEPIVVEQQGTSMEVGFAAVIAASVVGAVLAAVGALVLTGLWPRRGLALFIGAGTVLTLLSLFGTLGATTALSVAALMVMHLVTGTVVVIGNAVIHSRRKARAPQLA